MTTKQIVYCIELAHTLNFSRGADNMFVSQPTFSYQIRLLEEEVGFTIFDLKRAIEQGQNFSARYKDNISVCMMVRQALYFLPEAMRSFAEAQPDVQITPVFQYENSMEKFLQNESDIVFALKEQTRQIPGIQVHDLFESRIYLITDKDDPLAEKNLIREEDLYGRTLMVGGGSPLALRTVQHRLISSGKIDYFNSADHDTTLTNVAAGRGVCDESFSCVLCTHKEDRRDSLRSFLAILTKLYTDAVAFPL